MSALGIMLAACGLSSRRSSEQAHRGMNVPLPREAPACFEVCRLAGQVRIAPWVRLWVHLSQDYD